MSTLLHVQNFRSSTFAVLQHVLHFLRTANFGQFFCIYFFAVFTPKFGKNGKWLSYLRGFLAICGKQLRRFAGFERCSPAPLCYLRLELQQNNRFCRNHHCSVCAKRPYVNTLLLLFAVQMPQYEAIKTQSKSKRRRKNAPCMGVYLGGLLFRANKTRFKPLFFCSWH